MSDEAIAGSHEEEDVTTEVTETETSAIEGEKGKELTEEQKEEHKERSRLGRRLSKIEEVLQRFIETTTPVIENLQTVKPQIAETSNVLRDDDFITKKDLDRYLHSLNDKRSEETKRYESGYLQHLIQLGKDEDPELHEDLVKEITRRDSPFNVRYSSDPVADAERNYYRAMRAMLKKGKPERENPLKGEKPKIPIGVGGDTTVKEKEGSVPVLDEFAKDFIARTNMTDDSVKKALKGEMPLSLKKY